MKRACVGEEGGCGSDSVKGSSETEDKRKIRKMCAPQLVEKSASDTEQDAPDFDGVHPLLIDHIVDKIIGYTMTNSSCEWHCRQQLLSFRQVNWTWNRSATKELQKLPSACWSVGVGLGSEKKMAEFMKIMMNSEILPYTKVELGAKFFTSENKDNLENFFLSTVQSLTHLTITIGQDSFFDLDVDKLSIGLDLSKLKLLSIKVSLLNLMSEKKKRMRSVEQLICRQTQFLKIFKMLLGAAKTLDEFEFVYPAGQLGDGTKDLEPAFVDTIFESLTDKIKRLYLVCRKPKRNEQFLRFRTARTIKAKLYGENDSEESLNSFMVREFPKFRKNRRNNNRLD